MYKIKEYSDGRRVKQRIVGGKVVSSQPLSRTRKTKLKKRLERQRRRIRRV